MSEVLSVKPKNKYSIPNGQENSQFESALLFSLESTRYWFLWMDKAGVSVVTKVQMVDFLCSNTDQSSWQDAQICIYHVSWQSNLCFSCVLDEQCAKELAGVPGVLSVEPDDNFRSENKNYGGNSTSLLNSSATNHTVLINPGRLFVTGLSFYTSEKTLRTAFEGIGDLAEVKVIMDKVSKRSKGYAFKEYTTEEAASVALKEMNGKMVNGWIIVVNYAKNNPRSSHTRYVRGHSRRHMI